MPAHGAAPWPLEPPGGPVRLSFLTDTNVLADTLNLLEQAGVPQPGIGIFRKAVERYLAGAWEFDFARFPSPIDGYYDFASADGALAALPHPLCETVHAYDFNCFDVAIVVAEGNLRTGVGPDQVCDPFLVPHIDASNHFMVLPVSTARQAFPLLYQDWYREFTEGAFSDPDRRIALTAALCRFHLLPPATSETNLQSAVQELLRLEWRKEALVFPKDFELVLCHEVAYPLGRIATAHAGLLFARRGGYTFLEKAGGRGPFVRLDFNQRRDLILWLAGMFRGAGRLGYTHHFVTFNDSSED